MIASRCAFVASAGGGGLSAIGGLPMLDPLGAVGVMGAEKLVLGGSLGVCGLIGTATVIPGEAGKAGC